MKTLAQFANALKQAQKARKLTINELAERTGLSRLSVRQILNGESAPRLTNALALAEELGFELVLVPKEAAQSFEAEPIARTVLTDTERKLGVTAPPPPPRFSPPRR